MLTLIEINKRINLVDNISNKLEKLEYYCIIGKDLLDEENKNAANYINNEIVKIEENYKLINNLKSLLD